MQHGDFARFCDIAIGSLTETESHLKVAVAKATCARLTSIPC